MTDRPQVELPHDKQICIVAAQEISDTRNGGVFIPDSFPDEQERTKRAIDLIGHDEIGIMSVEHTLVESYADQTHDNSRVAQLRNLIEERIGSLEKPGRYTLCLHTRGAAGIPRRGLTSAADQLEAWLRSQRLPVPEIPPRAKNYTVATPPEVPIAVTLFRLQCDPRDDGSLMVALLRDSNPEAQRRHRVEGALLSKGPKLEESRLPGGVTLLALENRDFIMANPTVIAQAIYDVCGSFSPVPDAVVCVDTTAGEGHWLAYRVKFLKWWASATWDRG